jgi:hypothetical protein
VAVILEVKSGPMAGKKIALKQGQSVSVGRTDKANFAFPHDERMSRVHFKLECDASGVRVIDCGSSNGTLLNGAKIGDARVADGNEIRAGDTFFIARILPDMFLAPAGDSGMRDAAATPGAKSGDITSTNKSESASAPAVVPPAPAAPRPLAPPAAVPGVPPSAAVPPAPAAKPAAPPPAPAAAPPAAAPRPAVVKGPVSFGSWVFGHVPGGWEVQEGYGMQQVVKDAFPASLVATEEMLPSRSLSQYVEAQINMMRQYLREPTIEPALPPAITGAEETIAFEVRYSTKDRQAIYYQRIYARVGEKVFVLTLTTLESDRKHMHPVFADILKGAAIEAKSPVS